MLGEDHLINIGKNRNIIRLADRAANDIRKLIDASTSQVRSGAVQVHEAGRTMQNIVNQVQNVTALISQISHATSEQAQGLSELTRAVAELDDITKKNAVLVEESAHVSSMVKHRASRLEAAVTVLQ